MLHHTLKLTITAVGENDSVFLTPCDPVTLHESSIQDPEQSGDSAQDELPDAARKDDDVMVMVED